MADLRAVVDNIRRVPGMYFGRSDPTYAECSAYLYGWDAATGGAALDGFRDSLTARAGEQWEAFAWSALVSVIVRARTACAG